MASRHFSRTCPKNLQTEGKDRQNQHSVLDRQTDKKDQTERQVDGTGQKCRQDRLDGEDKRHKNGRARLGGQTDR